MTRRGWEGRVVGRVKAAGDGEEVKGLSIFLAGTSRSVREGRAQEQDLLQVLSGQPFCCWVVLGEDKIGGQS